MLRKIRSLVAIALVMVTVLTSGTITLYAKELNNSDNTGTKYEGYTKEGIKYTAYQTEIYGFKNIGTDIKPQFVVTKEITTNVSFSGWIVPEEVMLYDQIEPSYGIRMTGRLYRESYIQDVDFILRKETRATYKGTVFGQL